MTTLLIRYGAVPEVGRFEWDQAPEAVARGEKLVVASRRGTEIGTVLEAVREKKFAATNGSHAEDATESSAQVLRRATAEDVAEAARLRRDAQADFEVWQHRINDWQLALELIDLEWMLDRQKLVLYVLGGRGPDTTKLALQAAAAGLAVIEVQPVDASGLVAVPAAGGCGSGDCGCHE